MSCSDKESKLVTLEKTICELKRKLSENEESYQVFKLKDKTNEEKNVIKIKSILSWVSYIFIPLIQVQEQELVKKIKESEEKINNLELNVSQLKEKLLNRECSFKNSLIEANSKVID